MGSAAQCRWVLVGLLLIVPSALWADHGALDVDLEPGRLGINSTWTMVLPIGSMLVGFLLFIVGLWLRSQRAHRSPEFPPSDPAR